MGFSQRIREEERQAVSHQVEGTASNSSNAEQVSDNPPTPPPTPGAESPGHRCAKALVEELQKEHFRSFGDLELVTQYEEDVETPLLPLDQDPTIEEVSPSEGDTMGEKGQTLTIQWE